MSNQERINRITRRNKSIRVDFAEMTNVKHLDSDWVLDQLSEKYHLAKTTIWKIVARQDFYKDL
jgi:hypothetical protein